MSNLKAERSSTPTPGNPDGTKSNPRFRTGLLTIRVLWAEGLGVPSGTPIPDVVQKALSSQQAKVALVINFLGAFFCGFILAYVRSWRLALALSAMLPCIGITGAIMNKFISTYMQ